MSSTLTCPKCGSKKTKLSATKPLSQNASLSERLLSGLKNLSTHALGGSLALGGTKYLICQDCGHCSMLQIR